MTIAISGRARSSSFPAGPAPMHSIISLNGRHLLALTAVWTVAPTILHAAVDPAAWEWRQTFTVDADGPMRMALSPALLDAARSDLADLRLLAPDGGEVPFVVLSDLPTPPAEALTFAASPRIEGTNTRIDVALARPTRIARVRLVTPAPSFVKGLSVDIQQASGSWQTLVDHALVFRTARGGEHLVVALGGAEAQAVRLTLDDAREQVVPVTAVVVETQRGTVPPPLDRDVAITATDVTTGESRLSLDFGLQHQPLATLTIATREPAFERRVRLLTRSVQGDAIAEHVLASGVLRRITLPGNRTFADLTLDVGIVTPAAHLELAIDHGDNPPLPIDRVTAGLRAVHLAFHATNAGTYTLLAGRPNANAPHYDVQAFVGEWRQLPLAAPAMADLERNPAFRAAEIPRDVPELAGPFDPEGWSSRRAVRVVTPGAQVLELDPAVLARARPDLADVRLVRGDRQVPYLLEHDQRQRSLALTLVAAPDSQRPAVGRWRIDLPQSGIPLTQLLVHITEPLFVRSPRVLEVLQDARGQPYPRLLGAANWSRDGADTPDRFAVPLHTAPSTNELFLEIDHGDNQPFTPVAVEAAYPIYRLRFRASTPGDCTLFYGNPQAHAPRYDLTLAAARLVLARENLAQLSPADVEPARPDHNGFSLGGPWAKVAFWVALGLVVMVLLFVVARLLPKPPDPVP